MNENLKQIIDLCNSYLDEDIEFDEFEKKYSELLFSCEYSEDVVETLDELLYDIALTMPLEMTEAEKKDYISEDQLKEKITQYLNNFKV